MISRKRILSNSCRSISQCLANDPFDDDVWFDLNSLLRDHVQEILDKYDQLDDEIWGKIICMERNRRIAKAYARSPVITIDNRCIGFNGDSIGLTGFENPYRDPEVMRVHSMIGDGVAVAADEDGNILLQMLERRRIFVTDIGRCSGLAHPENEGVNRNGKLINQSTNKIFDMRKFVMRLNESMMNSSVGVENLENSCFCAIAFCCKPSQEIIDTPVWIIIINIIAMEMLHRNLQLIGHLETLALDQEDDRGNQEVHSLRRRISKQMKGKDRKTSSATKSGTLMLCKQNNVLDSLRDVPTPDYDSALTDEYRFAGQKSLCHPHSGTGILNSVLRHLPLQTVTRQSQSWRRRRRSGPLQELESDESCTHIYSSICDSSSSGEKIRKKKPRATTISKSLRFFLRRSKS